MPVTTLMKKDGFQKIALAKKAKSGSTLDADGCLASVQCPKMSTEKFVRGSTGRFHVNIYRQYRVKY